MKDGLARIQASCRPACGVLLGALVAVLIGTGEARAAASDWDSFEHARVRLVAESATVGSAPSVRMGLHFRLDEGWKIYWRSPGDAGIPPRLEWSESRNLAALAISWPAPQRFSIFGLETAGYTDEVVLPLEARLARPGEPLYVDLGVDYLVCEEICIPASAKLNLELPAGAAASSPFAGLIRRYVARVPGGNDAAGLGVERVEAVWLADLPALRVTARAKAPFTDPDLFVEATAEAGDTGDLTFDAPYVQIDPDGRRAVLLAALSDGEPARGTLAGRRFTVTVVDGDQAVEVSAQALAAAQAAVTSGGFLGILALALLGGLILNLMPCVLPVLSLKLLNVVGHGGAAPGVVRAGFLASAAGILFSFLVLAASAVALKALGMSIGWGIQFQQPIFLTAMVLLVTLFACNLWGFFELRSPRFAAAIAERHAGRHHDAHGLGGHFLAGALATVLATPCSAPFLGTAVGFAFARGATEIFAIFLALGLGLALPYLLVAAVPRLATMLPRPGAWMVMLRRGLGFALAATGLWLVTVLASQQGDLVAGAVALVMLALGAALWAGRRLGGRARRLAPAAAVGLAALALATSLLPASAARDQPAAVESHWRPFDLAAIPGLVGDGRIVFVDVTADWCITCQVNKSLVLDRGAVADWLKSDGVIAMRADWTRPDPRIARYLEGFGRYGIPFNAVYGPGAPGGLALPEILSVGAVADAVRDAGGRVATARR
ncbi:MAG: protein-disulfide reductase DsbD family protein [Kiloniellales bacterium]